MKREQQSRQVRMRIEALKQAPAVAPNTADDKVSDPEPLAPVATPKQPTSRPSTAGTWTAILRDMPQDSSDL